MTLDGFLTFLTLIIAAYGVASSATRLRLRLRLFSVAITSIIGFFLVIYYEMLAPEPARLACPTFLGRLCRFLIVDRTFPSTAEIAFGVVIIWWLVAWFVLSRRSISSSALPNLRRLVDELFYEHRLAELVQVVEPHLALLAAAAGRKLGGARLYDLLRRWRRGESPMELLARGALEEALRRPPFSQRIIAGLKVGVGTIGRSLPSGKSKEEAAREILRVLLLSREVIEFIVLYRAAFGVKLLALPDVREVFEFSDDYLRALIATPHSTLYAEVENNQNYERATLYYFPEENKLLHFLFTDAKVAERLGVWKPLGEWVISRLRPDRYPEYTNSLNLSSDGFEDERFEDPTFVVVQFFDLMVSAAEYQDIKWHMWLYYFPHFMNGLTALYSDSGIGVDEDSERPTRAAYIIYAMFQAMRDWITAVNDLPAESSQLVLNNERIDHDNGNIPKSSILALGMCLRTLLLAENVGDRFKRTIVDLVVRGVDNLPRQGLKSAFRRVLIASIVQGGPRWGEVEQNYSRQLTAAYWEIDHVLRDRLDDLAAALPQ